MSARRVLVVAYAFPPVAGTGIERTLKHVTYLPESGWTPVVVAPANPAYRHLDPASLDRIPGGTEVHRAPLLEPAHARQLLRRLLRREAATDGGGERGGGAASTGAEGSRLRSLLNAAWARIIPAIFFPDDQLLWAPSAALVGLRADRRGRVDAIYSSAPPFSSHLAAGLLRGLLRVPWVADFRDPWIGNTFARPLGAPHRRLQAVLERWIVSHADRSVFATGRLRDRYAARYPALADRFEVVPNGYDLADLAALAPASKKAPAMAVARGTFTIVYTGSVYGADELRVFLDGVERLLERRPELGARLRVEFIGWFNAENRALAARRLPELDPVVRHLGQQPRLQALARLAAADAALLLMAAGRDQDVGTKAYEYIGLSKPILAVTPPGAARETLEELDWGLTADPTPEGVADGLERIVDAAPPTRAADPERRFERRSLSRQLARLLDSLVPQDAGHR
jgi:glycosyltransferase involved in cell wall biosynthesis